MYGICPNYDEASVPKNGGGLTGTVLTCDYNAEVCTYDSVRLGSGEATPLALKNERPFWFSKVRSYAHV